jgi:hypothetical protein
MALTDDELEREIVEFLNERYAPLNFAVEWIAADHFVVSMEGVPAVDVYARGGFLTILSRVGDGTSGTRQIPLGGR